MLSKESIAKRHQLPVENLLMEIGTLAAETPNLLDLSIGDPDLVTPTRLIEEANQQALKGATHYTASGGSQSFIEAVQAFYQRQYGLAFEKNQIRATVGALHGMYLALQVILDPGDEVIIHEPYFSPYRDQVLYAGGQPVFIPTYEKDDFQIDLSILEAAITPKTKALIVNSPNNPTGAVFSAETFAKIAELAKKYHFYILSDEVYEAFTFEQDFVPMAHFAPEHTLTFSSFSKAFAMTGWRLGYMIAPAYINDVAKVINESITYSAPTLSQEAGIYGLDHYQEFVPEIVATFKERLAYVAERVAAIPFLSLHPVKGSMYAFINIQKTGLDSVAFVEKCLKEKQVLLIPGKAFGASGEGYVRLAATQSLATLATAFDKIESLSFT